eukprot:31508-Pelagococcus_subviridis.AAC.15
MPSPFSSGSPTAAATRSSTIRTVGVCPFVKNIPAEVRIPLFVDFFPPSATTVDGASCAFASAIRCRHSSSVRKFLKRYAFGRVADNTSGGDRGNPGTLTNWSARAYTDLGSGRALDRNRSSDSAAATGADGLSFATGSSGST